MSTKVIVALLAIIVVVILLLTSQRFAEGLRNRVGGVIPGVRPVTTLTPTPTPVIVKAVTPTPIPQGMPTQNTTKGGIAVIQTPDTGPTELSLILISSFGVAGYALNRFTKKRS